MKERYTLFMNSSHLGRFFLANGVGLVGIHMLKLFFFASLKSNGQRSYMRFVSTPYKDDNHWQSTHRFEVRRKKKVSFFSSLFHNPSLPISIALTAVLNLWTPHIELHFVRQMVLKGLGYPHTRLEPNTPRPWQCMGWYFLQFLYSSLHVFHFF